MKETQNSDKKVEDLGLGQPITRRDLLHRVGLSATALAAYGLHLSPHSLAEEIEQALYAPEKNPDYYPPARHGLRGSHPGSFDVAHGQRDGQTWDAVNELDEEFDLVEWVPVDQAIEQLTFKNESRIVEKALPMAEEQPSGQTSE